MACRGNFGWVQHTRSANQKGLRSSKAPLLGPVSNTKMCFIHLKHASLSRALNGASQVRPLSKDSAPTQRTNRHPRFPPLGRGCSCRCCCCWSRCWWCCCCSEASSAASHTATEEVDWMPACPKPLISLNRSAAERTSTREVCRNKTRRDQRGRSRE